MFELGRGATLCVVLAPADRDIVTDAAAADGAGPLPVALVPHEATAPSSNSVIPTRTRDMPAFSPTDARNSE
ncbi:hypothetical protein GCM10027572_18740 [Flexivirga lutea]